MRRFFFFNWVRLTITEEPSIWIEITEKLAGKIQKTLGQEWFEKAE